MGFVPFFPVSMTGSGLKIVTALGSKVICHVRSNSFLKKANKELFLPVNLKLEILSTYEMMTKIGLPRRQFVLPPLSTDKDTTQVAKTRVGAHSKGLGPGKSQLSNDDARVRRLRAIEGFVQPLTFHLGPAPIPKHNWLKRIGFKHVNETTENLNDKLHERREDNARLLREDVMTVDMEQRNLAKASSRIEERMAEDNAMPESESGLDERKRAKKEEELRKEMSKLEEKIAKATTEQEKNEEKRQRQAEKRRAKSEEEELVIAQDIQWVVITIVDSSIGESEPGSTHLDTKTGLI